MKEALKDYVCKWENNLNVPLMTKSADAHLVDYIIDAWKSLEVVRQIKFISYEYSEKESDIDINQHIFKREKHRKKKDKYDIKYISDDRVGKLTVHLEITMLESNPETGESKYKVYPIKKTMLIPLQDEEGYFYIKNKRYYMIYQMLEKSTYTSSSSVTLKSLMPIAVKRHIITDVEDVDGNIYSLPYYSVFVFRKEIIILLFYLSKGLLWCLDYLNVSNVISFIDQLPTNRDPLNLYFGLSSKCYLVVDKKLFNEYPYIQSIVGGFEAICTSRVTLEQLDEPRQWIKKIANPANYEKGLSVLKYFNRLLDETTKKVLKLPEYFKEDIYALLKWLMMEFNTLRLKDNCDLGKLELLK